ncbi:MAG: O-antigen ligase family protein [Candidatus Gracilibacteria bacterium]
MSKLLDYCRKNFSFLIISSFWLFALLNPVFKKYDYGAEYPLVILFGVLILFLAVKEFENKREKVFLEPLFLGIFFLAISVSFYFSHTKNYGLSEVMAFSSMVPFYLLYAHKKNDWSEKFLKVITVGLFLSVIIGFVFYFFYADVRAFGPFFNIFYHANKWPNAFALFMLMSWPILLIMHKEKFTAFRVLGLAFVLGLFILIYSRGALIVLGGQMLLLLFYYFKRIRIKMILIFLSVVVLSIGVFTLANYIRELQYQTIDVEEKATFGNGESLTSFQERRDFWEGSVKLIEQEPVFGWGPFSFRYAYNGIQETFLGNSDHPHNIFLKIGVENGLVALGAFVFFLITVLVTVVKRFPKLSQIRKDFVYLIFVAIAGAFAHSMIDYNFNFMANLLLLFSLLIVIRSSVAEKVTKERRSFLSLAVALVIIVFALYEGIILVLSQVANPAFLSYSFYPRNYYLSTAEKDLEKNNFGEALGLLSHETGLNSLDAQANYLEGVAYCDKDFQSYNVLVCKNNFGEALALNPLNDFIYYRDYIRLLAPNSLSPNDKAVIEKAKSLLENYFEYVKANVHFTAYTQNVEAAYEIAGLLTPYLSAEESEKIKKQSEEMLKTAKKLRANKAF